jgi:flagellar hook-associated protein 1 FlgK
LDVARSGLQAAQIQLAVTGHNIANVNQDGYSREEVTLTTRSAQSYSYGDIGRGVQVSSINRVRDEFLDQVYRQEVSGLGSANVRASYFTSIENIFQEPGDSGFGEYLSSFFDSLDDFANNVEESTVRTSVVTEAQSLATSLNQVSTELDSLRTNANEEVRSSVPEINSLTTQIASLNENIRTSELDGSEASDLRDQRDLLLDQLSEMVNVTYSEREDGEVDVFVSGDMLVTGDTARELVAERDPTLDSERGDLVTIRFADNDKAVKITDGSVYGALQARDVDIVAAQDSMDEIAKSFIQEVNKIQSTGNGLDNLSGTITSSNAVTNASTALSSAGLPFDVSAGSFDVVVYDSSGTATTTTIDVTSSTTLNDLVNSLNGVSNFSASVNADGTLSLGASSGYTYSFANDSAGALTALGVNGLFTGDSASSISVNQDIVDNVRLLSSSYSTDNSETGDNAAALDLADVRNALVFEDGTATIQNYYETLIVNVGADASSNTQTLEVQQSFVDDYANRRLEVSGVSIDEETTYMMQYQRGYEAAARVITVVDRMLDVLLAMGA